MEPIRTALLVTGEKNINKFKNSRKKIHEIIKTGTEAGGFPSLIYASVAEFSLKSTKIEGEKHLRELSENFRSQKQKEKPWKIPRKERFTVKRPPSEGRSRVRSISLLREHALPHLATRNSRKGDISRGFYTAQNFPGVFKGFQGGVEVGAYRPLERYLVVSKGTTVVNHECCMSCTF